MFDPSSPMIQKQLTLPEKDDPPGGGSGKENAASAADKNKKDKEPEIRPAEKVPVMPVIGKSNLK